ncbi:MAG: hypothetical protein ACJA0H_000572 [Francisellaceae bacterium]|jgi:hypothetical protein
MKWLVNNMVWIMSTMALILVLYSAYSIYNSTHQQAVMKQKQQQAKELGKQVSLFVNAATRLAVMRKSDDERVSLLEEMHKLRQSIELLASPRKEYNQKLINLLDKSIDLAKNISPEVKGEEPNKNEMLKLNQEITTQTVLIIQKEIESALTPRQRKIVSESRDQE